ncbi:MAG: divergent PAP2 family protein [Fusobacterium sp.]|nr:divergent PAP2 family protein [Fusobacterium sp.]
MLIEFMRNNGLEVLFLGLSAAVCAQVLKLFTFAFVDKKFNFKIFTTTGGMPSAHSAGVMAVTTTVGLIDGFTSTVFAVSSAFALVTMYDAAGLRRAAGKTAACLNRMMDDFYNHDVQAIGGKLKELLGHTPFEVFVGAALGIVYSFVMHTYLFN